MRNVLSSIAAALALLLPPTSVHAAPAWWQISDGHASVWVLGAPQLAPKDFDWDTSDVERRLAKASRLIIGVQPRDEIKAMAVLVSSALSRAPRPDSIAPVLWRRFATTSSGIGKNPNHYANMKPALAGLILAGDVHKAEDIKSGGIESTVRKLARKAGVPEAPAGAYDAGAMASAAQQLSAAGQQTCLSATLDVLERGPAPLRAIAADWNRGEPRFPPPSAADLACIAAMPGVKALNERNLDAEAGAVAAALKSPGGSIAVFDLQRLTMPGGILARLRARGLTVTGPTP